MVLEGKAEIERGSMERITAPAGRGFEVSKTEGLRDCD